MKIIIILISLCSFVFSQEMDNSSILQDKIIPVFLMVDGVALMTMWTIDIHQKKLLRDGIFSSKEDGKLFWPHLLAEYGTAIGLVVSAYGLYYDKQWAEPVSLVSLGALTYTSLSSMSWSLADKNRYLYAVPMIFSLTGAGISIGVIF